MKCPKEHRFGILLVDCLGVLGNVKRRREIIEELGRRIELYQTEAREELARRAHQQTKTDSSRTSQKSEVALQAEQKRVQF